jgi:hypothetical protein
MDADLDLLLTAVYRMADDFLRRKSTNARRKITDPEMVALCVAQAMMRIPSDYRFIGGRRQAPAASVPHPAHQGCVSQAAHQAL